MKKLFTSRHTNLLFFALLSVTLTLPAIAQNNSQWSAITSFNTVNGITQSSDGVIWGVSDGGLFSFDEGQFNDRITPVEGMHRLDGRAIYYLEDFDLLIIGYIDGMIDLYDIEENSFERIEDIRRVQAFTSRGINDILAYENQVYIATDFGIVTYNPSTFLVSQSYTKLGTFDRGTPVLDIDIVDGIMYLATQRGVAVANLDSNLDLESSWTNYTEENSLSAGSIQSIAFFNGQIVASTENENFVFINDTWQTNEVYGNQQNINYRRDFSADILVAYNQNRIFLTPLDGQTQTLNLTSSGISDVFFDDQIKSSLYVASVTMGMGVADLNELTFQFISPEGPNVNFFEGMTFDRSTFISGTTRQSSFNTLLDNAKGYYVYDGDEWSNFNSLNNEELNQKRFRLAFQTTFNSHYFYIGSWGSGIARHDRETDEITVFNAENSTLRGWAADDPGFPVISGLQTDSNEAVWATSRFATNPLYVQLPGEEEWINYGKSSAVSGTDEYISLFIDSFDQKWITLQSTGMAGRGLLVLDTGESSSTDDSFGVKLSDDLGNGNLPNINVTAIIEDRNGEVWVGTERGIARYIFPQFITTGTAEEKRGQWLLNEDPDAESPFLLRDINVTTMAVNSANQKWVGTAGEGIWLLNEAGSAILKHFTTDNSPLLSNIIKDITVFDETGEVYISTELGLSVFRDTPKKAVEKMDDLKVYPNPFEYNRHSTIFIENLSELTTIRVLGVDGTLIRKLENRGGRAEWNGMDHRGQEVGSGVYIVVALGPDGNQRGIGKVAIIR